MRTIIYNFVRSWIIYDNGQH